MKSPFDCIMPDGKIAAYIIYRKMEEEGGDMNSNLQQVDGGKWNSSSNSVGCGR